MSHDDHVVARRNTWGSDRPKVKEVPSTAQRFAERQHQRLLDLEEHKAR